MAVGTGGQGGNCPQYFANQKNNMSLKITTYTSVYSNKAK